MVREQASFARQTAYQPAAIHTSVVHQDDGQFEAFIERRVQVDSGRRSPTAHPLASRALESQFLGD